MLIWFRWSRLCYIFISPYFFLLFPVILLDGRRIIIWVPHGGGQKSAVTANYLARVSEKLQALNLTRALNSGAGDGIFTGFKPTLNPWSPKAKDLKSSACSRETFDLA